MMSRESQDLYVVRACVRACVGVLACTQGHSSRSEVHRQQPSLSGPKPLLPPPPLPGSCACVCVYIDISVSLSVCGGGWGGGCTLGNYTGASGLTRQCSCLTSARAHTHTHHMQCVLSCVNDGAFSCTGGAPLDTLTFLPIRPGQVHTKCLLGLRDDARHSNGTRESSRNAGVDFGRTMPHCIHALVLVRACLVYAYALEGPRRFAPCGRGVSHLKRLRRFTPGCVTYARRQGWAKADNF